MKSIDELTGTHLRTYTTLFQHPLSHNLEWRSVRTLLEALGEVAEEANGNLKVTRNGETLVLHPPVTKDVAGADEIMALRHFLERSSKSAMEPKAEEANWLLVIDRQEARIYRSLAAGAVPQRIHPHASAVPARTATPAKSADRPVENPNRSSFYEPVAGVLKGANKFLVFGSGTGTSSEMDQFLVWLKRHQPAVAQRKVAAVVVDENHRSEAQLLAQARELFAASVKLAT